MRYAISRFEEWRREFAYRIYVTDILGHMVGLKNRYYDMVNGDTRKDETRTPEEIISKICAKLATIGGE